MARNEMLALLLRTARAAVSAAVVSAMLLAQFESVAHADDMIDAGRRGQSFGTGTSPTGLLGTTDDAGNITLFPDSQGAKTYTPSQLFGDYNQVNRSSLEGAWNSDGALNQLGQGAQNRLSTEDSRPGAAYRTLTGAQPNLRNGLPRTDPIFGGIDHNLSNPNLMRSFADCSTSTQFQLDQITTHSADIRTCDRPASFSGECTLYRQLLGGVLRHTGGPLGVASCGPGCMQIYVGEIGDNYRHATCGMFETSTTFDVISPEAVISATVEYVKYDDFILLSINNTPTWAGPFGGDRLQIEGGRVRYTANDTASCEQRTEFEGWPGTDITRYFKARQSVNMNIKNVVGVAGEAYVRLRIQYDPALIIQEDGWAPRECLANVNAVRELQCPASYTCKQMPTLDAQGCAIVNGVPLCESMFPGQPFPGISPLCQQVDFSAECEPNVGQMEPWTDTSGIVHSPWNAGGTDTCLPYANNPACTRIETRCVENSTLPSGACTVREEVYDCGSSASLPTVRQETSYQCAGPIRCLGTECVSQTREQSTDFGRAAAALHAAQFMSGDLDCGTDGTQSDGSACIVFKGKPLACKRAVGGIQNCCQDNAPGVSVGQYINMIFAVGQLDTAIMSMESTSAIRGSWEVLREPFATAWDNVQQPLTSAWNSIWGGTQAEASDVAANGLFATVQQTLMQNAAQWTADIFGQEAANQMFQAVVRDASGEIVSAGAAILPDGAVAEGTIEFAGLMAEAASVLSFIGTVYMIYQITMMLIQIIWACEQSEFEFMVQRKLKNCHYIGSYCKTKVLGICIERREAGCCFTSPLSRIIQEQVRPQLGKTWGTAQQPTCEGLRVDEIGRIDWSMVNLDEWLQLLAESGRYPTNATLSPDSLTGSGNPLALPGREDAATRATKRLQGLDVTGIRSQAGQEMRDRLPH